MPELTNRTGVNANRLLDDVTAFPNERIARDREAVGRKVQEQYAAEPDVVIDETDDGSGDEPPALEPRKQRGIRLRELLIRSKFLEQRSDGRPEHPESGRDQHVHHEDMPHLNVMGRR